MNRHSIKFILLFGVFLSFVYPKLTEAYNSEVSPITNVDYGTGVGKKLGRGISNVAFGWLELPKAVEDVGKENGFFSAITWGPIYGLGKTAMRTLAGAYEVATFPAPVPQNFEPLIKPEFILGDQ